MTTLSDIQLSESHVSFIELCHCTNLKAENLLELIDYDIITPSEGAQPQEWQFNITAINLATKAERLHRDLDIDWADVALILKLFEEIAQLKNENSHLKRQLNRFLLQAK